MLTDPARFPNEPAGMTHWVKDGSLFDRPDRPADLGPGWNRLELEVRGEALRAWVNGKPVTDRKLDAKAGVNPFVPGLVRRKGPLGLRAFTGTARFRKIEVQELPAPPPPAPAPADGFVSLFNGKDLTGWFIDGGDQGHWKVQPGEILAQCPDAKHVNWLLTDRTYADYLLRLEFRLEEGARSGVAVRAFRGEWTGHRWGKEPVHPMLKLTDPAQFPGEPPGSTQWAKDGNPLSQPDQAAELAPGWNRLELEVRGETLRASVNGKPVADRKLDDTPPRDQVVPGLNRFRGRIGLQAQNGVTHFRNLEVKELPAAGK